MNVTTHISNAVLTLSEIDSKTLAGLAVGYILGSLAGATTGDVGMVAGTIAVVAPIAIAVGGVVGTIAKYRRQE